MSENNVSWYLDLIDEILANLKEYYFGKLPTACHAELVSASVAVMKVNTTDPEINQGDIFSVIIIVPCIP